MTVNTTNITSGPYLGNDIADGFSYGFRIEDKTQLIVYETDDAGVETILTVDTDYTVAGIGIDAGGIVTRVAGALPTDYEWYIRSDYKETQLTPFASQGGFFPDVHEAAMDKLTFLIQQMTDISGRSIRLSEGYSGGAIDALPDPQVNNFLRWKSDLSGFENVSLGTSDLNLAVRQLSEFSSLSDAFTQIGSVNEVELWIDANDSSIDSPLVKPDNIKIRHVNGFILDGTSTLTIDQVRAEFQQVFGSNITVTGLKQSSPEWWGIDGTADDVEIQKAVDATAGGMVCFDPFNQYILNAGLTIFESSTTLFSPVKKASLITSANDIYMLTIDDCQYVKILNIGLSNTHGTPTKACLLLAGKAKDGEYRSLYLSGNKYGILFDGAQGSAAGAIFYNSFHDTTATDQTDRAIYFTDAAGMNDNTFWGGDLHSTITNALVRVAGNSNKFIGVGLETAVSGADFATFAITDKGLANVYIANRFETDGHGILLNSTLTDESKGTVIQGNYWACNSVRVAIYDGIANSDTTGKDKAFNGLIKGVFVSTTVDVESASGQKVVSVAATTDYHLGQVFVLDYGNANEEWHIIDSIQIGVSITSVGNLANTHAVAVDVEGCNQLHGMETFSQGNTDALIFYKAGKSRLRVDDETVMVGDNNETPGVDAMHILPKTGQTQYHIITEVDSTNSRLHQRFENPNGVVGSIATSVSATSFNTSSDYRLKENVQGLTQAVQKLKALKPITFSFKKDKDMAVDGFLAHELKEIIPGAATGKKDEVDEKGKPVYQGIDQSKIVPVLTKALQEAFDRIEKLEQK